MHDFSRKFLILYSITWQNIFVWFPLLLEILGNMCIAIFCFLDCDFINFENNVTFLIKQFFYLTKNSRQAVNILRTKWAFKVKQKVFSSQRLSQNWECTFNGILMYFWEKKIIRAAYAALLLKFKKPKILNIRI